MRIKLLILLAMMLVFFVGNVNCEAEAEAEAEDEGGITIEDFDAEDSEDLMEKIQGIAESTVWIIEFHDSDPEEGLKDDIQAGFSEEPYDEPEYEDYKYKFMSIDINDKKWADTLDELGMTGASFQATYPVAMIMRKRKGLFCWGYELSLIHI